VRNVAFFCVGLVLILLQANFYRLLGPLSAIQLGDWLNLQSLLHGATPSLILPLIIFLGVNEPSMARGALLSFGFGWILDILAGAPMSMFRFTCVALWWLARVAGVRLTAQTSMTRMPLAFGFSVVESAIVLALIAIFGADGRRPLEIATVILPRAIATALLAPLVFRLAHRLHQGTAPTAAPTSAEASR
jgi:rod shape-determining protein MreD